MHDILSSQVLVTLKLGFGFFDDEPQRRTLGIRDRQILYERSGRKCQSCRREISFTEMQVGHKTAYSRGGSTSLRSCVSLCYSCNKLQGTDSWGKFQRKMGSQSGQTKAKNGLSSLSIAQLKYLCDKYGIKVRGKIIDDFFSSYKIPPSKKQYINALSKVVSSSDIAAAKTARPVKKRKRRQSSSWSFW